MAGKWSWVKGDLDKILVMGTPVVRAALEKIFLYGCSIETLVEIVHVFVEGAWQWKSAKVARHVKNVTKDTCSRYTVFILLFAAKVLQALGFGLTAMTLSIPWKSAGQQSWLQNFPCQAAVLALLQISDKSTPTLAVNSDHRPDASEVDANSLVPQVGPRRRAQTSGASCACRQFFARA